MRIHNFFFLFFVGWFLLAIVRFSITIINSLDDIKLAFLSDEKKREILYEDEYIFLKKAAAVASSKEYCLLSRNGKLYFLGKYYFYPRKLYRIYNLSDNLIVSKCKTTPIITYLDTSAEYKQKVLKDFKQIREIRINNRPFGEIYKK